MFLLYQLLKSQLIEKSCFEISSDTSRRHPNLIVRSESSKPQYLSKFSFFENPFLNLFFQSLLRFKVSFYFSLTLIFKVYGLKFLKVVFDLRKTLGAHPLLVAHVTRTLEDHFLYYLSFLLAFWVICHRSISKSGTQPC